VLAAIGREVRATLGARQKDAAPAKPKHDEPCDDEDCQRCHHVRALPATIHISRPDGVEMYTPAAEYRIPALPYDPEADARIEALMRAQPAAPEPAKCRGCPHPPHLGLCTKRMGGTAYACGCSKQTPSGGGGWARDSGPPSGVRRMNYREKAAQLHFANVPKYLQKDWADLHEPICDICDRNELALREAAADALEQHGYDDAAQRIREGGDE
jgi:hypothetical protein